MTTTSLNAIRETIEGMSKHGQIEILRILRSHPDITLNENKNGIYVNLTSLPAQVIADMQKYIEYATLQETELARVEHEKSEYALKYFTPENAKTNDGIPI